MCYSYEMCDDAFSWPTDQHRCDVSPSIHCTNTKGQLRAGTTNVAATYPNICGRKFCSVGDKQTIDLTKVAEYPRGDNSVQLIMDPSKSVA